MEKTKKALNILGIVAAWILSIALVLMLIVSPIVLSVLSLLDVNTLADTVTEILVDQIAPSEKTADNYEITKLANGNGAVNDTVQSGESILTDMFGDSVTPEVMKKILASNAAKQFIAAYADGFTNALTGKGNTQIDTALVKKIINDNIDEVVELVKLASPDAANMDIEELKQKIAESVDQTAEEIAKTLPQPEQIKEAVLEENPELESALQVIARKDAIKAAYVGMIAIVCILIFLCRLPGFRGLRWLATDLFIGGGFCALQSVGLLIAVPTIQGGLAMDQTITALIKNLLKTLTTGVTVRTVVMLVAGAGLLVAYIYIRKALARKANAQLCENIPLADPSEEEAQAQDEVAQEILAQENVNP